MKTTIIIALSLASFTASAQKMSESKVPAGVRATFAKNFSAKDAKWEKEHGNYEANFVQDGDKMSALINPSGVLMETERAIPVAKLPAAAATYLGEHYKGITIKEAAQLTMPDGTARFEAEVKGMDIIFDGNGNFLKKQKG